MSSSTPPADKKEDPTAAPASARTPVTSTLKPAAELAKAHVATFATPEATNNAPLLTKIIGIFLFSYFVYHASLDLPRVVKTVYKANPVFSTTYINGSAVYGSEIQTIWYPKQLYNVSNGIREFWMDRAINITLEKLDTPCPWGAFGSVVVNHSDTTGPLGKFGREICIGVNGVNEYGNPTLHGEVANIQNCSAVLAQKPYSLTPNEILGAFSDLSLYTTGEPCPMCASSIRWSGFKETIFGTSIKDLISLGWMQIDIHSHEVFTKSWKLNHGSMTGLLGGVLRWKTDLLFAWQFREDFPCPGTCERKESGCAKPI